MVAGCLPIYYGKNTKIYETFPKNSFIDVADIDSFPQLLNILENLSKNEFMQRYNKCVEVMSINYKLRKSTVNSNTELLDLFIANVRHLIC